MLDFPVVTEEELWEMSKSELVNVVMRLQQISLISDDQIALYEKLVEMQKQTIEILREKKK